MLVRAPNPVWYFVDNVGGQLNDTFYLFVLENVFPYLPSPVYHDNQGLVPWTEPVQFLPNGTLPNNLYFNPDLVYRLQVRAGNTMDALLIDDVQNFVPGSGQVIPPTNAGSPAENQITNPQFAFINFVSPLTISSAGTYNIAPGWNLVVTGTGSLTVTQEIFDGNENIVNNPPYGLNINSNGFTTVDLVQTFENNGALWANNAVSTTITAKATTNNQQVTISYIPSTGSTIVIASGTVLISDFNVLQGAVVLPASANTDLSSVAFVKYQIALPGTGNVTITNVQVFGQDQPLAVSFEQETIERQIDHSFNVYADQLIIKPKKSIITAWNFALNPYQFALTALTPHSGQCDYITDQTILYQEAANNISTGQASAANGFGLKVAAIDAATNTRFALIQFIDPSTIAPYWNYYLSSLARARIFTSSGTQVHLKMRLIWRTSLPPTISPTEPITSWTLGQDPVFASGWTALAPLNDPSYLLPNSFSGFESASAYPAFSFDQFPMPAASTANMTLGIVIYTMDRMGVSNGDNIVFDKVSLVPNKFAVDTHPETFDEVLRQCQFYYEKSYPPKILAGSVSGGAIFQRLPLFYDPGASNRAELYAQSFGFSYKQTKRANVTPVLYSPSTGAASTLDIGMFLNGGQSGIAPTGFVVIPQSSYNLFSDSVDGANFNCLITSTLQATGGATLGFEGQQLFHYVVNARLGA